MKSKKPPVRVNGLFRFLGSNVFSWIVIGLFAAQATWIAFSALFPMPFDEYYHFGIIKIYAHQLNPIITTQPQEANIYGDITRMSSYLFHYLMSFPYRLIAEFASSVTIQVIFLRLINVAMVVVGLLLFKKLFKEAKISGLAGNLALLATSLIPIFLLLGPTINYDNLLFMLTPLVLIYANRIYSNKNIKATEILIFLLLCVVASLVKFSFLPIFVALFVFFGVVISKRHGKKGLEKLYSDFSKTKGKLKYLLLAIALIMAGLFIERFGINIVRYHSLSPDCTQVQVADICDHSLVGMRRKDLKNVVTTTPVDPVRYSMAFWLDAMSSGAVSTGANTSDHKLEGYSSPIILYLTMWSFLVISLFVIAYYWRELWGRDHVRLFTLVFVSYVGMLWLNLYTSYRSSGLPLAIQSRYLLVVIPLLLVVAAEAWEQLFKKYQLGAAILVLALLLISTQGGGFTTYVIRSKPTWYFQKRRVIAANNNLKKVVKPFIIGN